MEFAKSATSGVAVNKRFASFYAMQQFWEAAASFIRVFRSSKARHNEKREALRRAVKGGVDEAIHGNAEYGAERDINHQRLGLQAVEVGRCGSRDKKVAAVF